ncbi:MAG: 4-oxalocrotonate tautomerase DmpI [Pseudomonadota bacterium]
MPIVRIEGPKFKSLDHKRKMVEKITETVSEIFEMPKETVIVILKELEKENVGLSGKLVVDRD